MLSCRLALAVDDMILGPSADGDEEMRLQRATATYTAKVCLIYLVTACVQLILADPHFALSGPACAGLIAHLADSDDAVQLGPCTDLRA